MAPQAITNAATCLEFPGAVALARLVPRLPTGPAWWYEIKLDGHRMVL
ncbi:hypothetical protein ACFVHS_20215 [Streptomyces sp. NPDC057746]